MAAHGDNNGRSYLANEVGRQATELGTLGREISGVTATVQTLVAAEVRAGAHRQEIRSEIAAARSEQAQVAMSVTSMQAALPAMQAALDKMAATLGNHEKERQQIIGAGKIIAKIGKLGWALAGAIFAVLFALGGYIASHLPPSLFK